MTDEQRLQMITEQLLIVRDNLFRGMSKSIQKLQARSINEVLKLENFTQSPQRTWVGLTNQELADCWDTIPERAMRRVEAKLKEKHESTN
jgi:hypothetical protein